MTDEYWDRIRESSDFLDREYDRRASEDELAARSARLYDALRRVDHERARWELGIPQPDDSDADDARAQAVEDWSESTSASLAPTAEEQFDDHRRKLLVTLDVGRGLPASVAAGWAATVRAIDSVEGGLQAITALQGDCTRVEREHTARHGYSLDPDFDNELWDVVRELAWLESILRHVDEHQRGRGTGLFALSRIAYGTGR